MQLRTAMYFYVTFKPYYMQTYLNAYLPTVQNIIPPYGRGRHDSNLTLYPLLTPSSSALSLATRSATDTAEIRRGCVTTILQYAPCPDCT